MSIGPVWILEVTAVGAIAALISIVIPLLIRVAKSVDTLRADLRDTSGRFMTTDFAVNSTVNHASCQLE